MDVLLIAIGLQLSSGFLALTCSRVPRLAVIIGAGGASMGCFIALIPTCMVLSGGAPAITRLAWDVPHGAFCVELDVLSAFFLLPVLVLSTLAAIYGSAYVLSYRRKESIGGLCLFMNVFVGTMVMVLVARTVILFLLAWEVMSLAAFFLVTFEHEKAETRRAGWVYLIATHVGVAFVLMAFLILARCAGSLEFEAFRTLPLLGAGSAGLVFVLALVGFGAKAGLVPFHIWLPEAHPAAPSHVSALMSGVMIKMGLYGLLRVASFLGQPAAWWGATLAVVGTATALTGIALSLNQRDLKRVLAYSSIENIGLIALALGVGFWGLATHRVSIAALGMTAALLHIWNHALMKGLMFLAAGSVVHGAGEKDMEKLGGLVRRMPWTGSAMIAGAVALAALPPLNGFASKWLIYMSLIERGLATHDGGGLTSLLAVGLLALIGGLAVLAFVRLTGIVLLGAPRSEAAGHAHESSPVMIIPMLILVALCLIVGFDPQLAADMLRGTVGYVVGPGHGGISGPPENSENPLHVLGQINTWTVVAMACASVLLFVLVRRPFRAKGNTWGCGYVQPDARMQYTGSSFAEMMSEGLMPGFLRPLTRLQAPAGLFPAKSQFAAESPDPLSERVYEPFFRRWAARFARLRILQQGNVHIYLVYIAFMVVLALTWVSLRAWWRTS
jgi:formate hydrogenlyase subunit 3/multisubunit Na+/H+ antiporter MnhD subunit